MRIGVISDLHFIEGSPLPLAENLLRQLQNLLPIDLLFILGDSTMFGTPAEYELAYVYKRKLQALIPNILDIPGNHEIPSNEPEEILANPLRRYTQHLAALQFHQQAGFGKITYNPVSLPTFENDLIKVIGVNSVEAPCVLKNRRDGNGQYYHISHGLIMPDQLDLIKSFFNDTDPVDQRWRLIAQHHPIWPIHLPNSNTESVNGSITKNYPDLLNAYLSLRIHMVLTAHLHIPYMLMLKSTAENKWPIAMLYNGTAISNRLRGSRPNSFCLLEISENRMCYHRYDALGCDAQFELVNCHEITKPTQPAMMFAA